MANETWTTQGRLGRRVHLRPVRPSDYPLLYEAELNPPDDVLYRHRGRTPPYDAFVETLWSNVLTQYAIEERESGRLVGLVAAYDANFRDGHARIALYLLLPYRKLGWPLEGARLFINQMFHAFPFRKLYADIIDPNQEALSTALQAVMRQEGNLLGHTYVGGEYVDMAIYALHRSDWESAPRFSTADRGLADAIRQAESGANSAR